MKDILQDALEKCNRLKIENDFTTSKENICFLVSDKCNSSSSDEEIFCYLSAEINFFIKNSASWKSQENSICIEDIRDFIAKYRKVAINYHAQKEFSEELIFELNFSIFVNLLNILKVFNSQKNSERKLFAKLLVELIDVILINCFVLNRGKFEISNKFKLYLFSVFPSIFSQYVSGLFSVDYLNDNLDSFHKFFTCFDMVSLYNPDSLDMYLKTLRDSRLLVEDYHIDFFHVFVLQKILVVIFCESKPKKNKIQLALNIIEFSLKRMTKPNSSWRGNFDVSIITDYINVFGNFSKICVMDENKDRYLLLLSLYIKYLSKVSVVKFSLEQKKKAISSFREVFFHIVSSLETLNIPLGYLIFSVPKNFWLSFLVEGIIDDFFDEKMFTDIHMYSLFYYLNDLYDKSGRTVFFNKKIFIDVKRHPINKWFYLNFDDFLWDVVSCDINNAQELHGFLIYDIYNYLGLSSALTKNFSYMDNFSKYFINCISSLQSISFVHYTDFELEFHKKQRGFLDFFKNIFNSSSNNSFMRNSKFNSMALEYKEFSKLFICEHISKVITDKAFFYVSRHYLSSHTPSCIDEILLSIISFGKCLSNHASDLFPWSKIEDFSVRELSRYQEVISKFYTESLSLNEAASEEFFIGISEHFKCKLYTFKFFKYFENKINYLLCSQKNLEASELIILFSKLPDDIETFLLVDVTPDDFLSFYKESVVDRYNFIYKFIDEIFFLKMPNDFFVFFKKFVVVLDSLLFNELLGFTGGDFSRLNILNSNKVNFDLGLASDSNQIFKLVCQQQQILNHIVSARGFQHISDYFDYINVSGFSLQMKSRNDLKYAQSEWYPFAWLKSKIPIVITRDIKVKDVLNSISLKTIVLFFYEKDDVFFAISIDHKRGVLNHNLSHSVSKSNQSLSKISSTEFVSSSLFSESLDNFINVGFCVWYEDLISLLSEVTDLENFNNVLFAPGILSNFPWEWALARFLSGRSKSTIVVQRIVDAYIFTKRNNKTEQDLHRKPIVVNGNGHTPRPSDPDFGSMQKLWDGYHIDTVVETLVAFHHSEQIHFFGHGISDDLSFGSGLLFGSNKLSARMLLLIDCNTKFVNLSACCSATANNHLGVANFLAVAGVESVIGTLWSVEGVSLYCFNYLLKKYSVPSITKQSFDSTIRDLPELTIADIEQIVLESESDHLIGLFKRSYTRRVTPESKPWQHPVFWACYVWLKGRL